MLALAAILGALALGVISPGPSFVLVARLAVAASRRDALAAALGMGVGGVTFASLALVGLTALLAQLGALYFVLKLAGGAYLVFLAWRIWRAAPLPLSSAMGARPGARGLRAAFLLGLATQLSNPKTALVYASVFAALLPARPPLWMLAALPPLVFALEAGWYATVALSLSAAGPRAAYLRAKTLIDRVAGAVLGVLGARLMFAAGDSAAR